MLEAYAGFMGTINSIGWLIGGAVCSGLGIIFILDHILTVRKSWLLSGVISDVMKGRDTGNGTIFYPVISFQDPHGKTHKIKSDFGTNRLNGKTPGTKVRLYFRPDKPENIRLKNLVWFYFSLTFLVIGFTLSHFYLSAFHMTNIGLALGGFSLLFLLSGFIVRPRSGSIGFTSSKEENNASKEDFLSFGEHKERLSEERRGSRKGASILLLMATVLIISGLYMGKSQWHIANTFAKASGHVANHELRYVENSGKRTYYYYPIVEFTTQDGEFIRFEDENGSRAPSYEKNQSVKILYDPDTPGTAIIDRGIENWFLPLLVIFAGFFFGVWGLKNISKPH